MEAATEANLAEQSACQSQKNKIEENPQIRTTRIQISENESIRIVKGGKFKIRLSTLQVQATEGRREMTKLIWVGERACSLQI